MPAIPAITPIQRALCDQTVKTDRAAPRSSGEYDTVEYDNVPISTPEYAGKADTTDIAIDAATYANHLGGLIVYGIADTKGVPSRLMDVGHQ
ncbi:hypothetical protein [Acrocarpospora catenulata]|uniref:hypothetical protein n=1 Tax=Acrocarpospora catenulata TaxID=2836182 RepID=UPI001BDB6AF5|nr:hypothetical protein [Acrocarpospora catenulata]